jgi:hypothetical protein
MQEKVSHFPHREGRAQESASQFNLAVRLITSMDNVMQQNGARVADNDWSFAT